MFKVGGAAFKVGGAQFTVGVAEFTVGGAVFTVGGAELTVGGACLQKEEHINRAVGPPKWYWGRFFIYTSVSNDFSEQKSKVSVPLK